MDVLEEVGGLEEEELELEVEELGIFAIGGVCGVLCVSGAFDSGVAADCVCPRMSSCMYV